MLNEFFRTYGHLEKLRHILNNQFVRLGESIVYALVCLMLSGGACGAIHHTIRHTGTTRWWITHVQRRIIFFWPNRFLHTCTMMSMIVYTCLLKCSCVFKPPLLQIIEFFRWPLPEGDRWDPASLKLTYPQRKYTLRSQNFTKIHTSWL